jgi:hypothetical protein
MQNILTDVKTTIDTAEQINSIGMAHELTAILAFLLGVVSFVVSMWSVFKKLDKRIDERIDARIKPSLILLQDTVKIVKSLEKNTAEMNATLSILRDIMISHKRT